MNGKCLVRMGNELLRSIFVLAGLHSPWLLHAAPVIYAIGQLSISLWNDLPRQSALCFGLRPV